MTSRVRSSLSGGLRHQYDCVEVQGQSISAVLSQMAEQADHVENDLYGCVISVAVSEEFEPQHAVIGRLWVADAVSCGALNHMRQASGLV